MEYLLRTVADDAVSLFSEPSTDSGSTIYGIGSTSGKAVVAVGTFVIDSIGNIKIRTRLRSIRGRMENYQCTMRDYCDLFELQRVGVYPGVIRRSSWMLIIESLKQGGIDRELFISVLLKLCETEETSLEVMLFIRQLVAVKLYGWRRDPVGMSLLPFRLRVSVMDALDKGFFLVVSELLAIQPAIIHGAIDVGMYALLFGGWIPRLTVPVDPEVSLSTFFARAEILAHGNTLVLFHQRYWSPFFTFTKTSTPEEAQFVITHLLRRCISLATSNSTGALQVQCAHYFLSLAAQMRTQHSTYFGPLFSDEIHSILDAHSNPHHWIPSDSDIGTEITAIGSHLRTTFPEDCRVVPPPMVFGFSGYPSGVLSTPELLGQIIHSFLTIFTTGLGENESLLKSQVLLTELALVSRLWYSLVLESLYSRPLIMGSSRFHRFIKTLRNSPQLAKRVIALNLVHVGDRDVIPHSRDVTPWLGSAPNTSFPDLELPSLETLRLDFCSFPCRLPFRPLHQLRKIQLYHLSKTPKNAKGPKSSRAFKLPNNSVPHLPALQTPTHLRKYRLPGFLNGSFHILHNVDTLTLGVIDDHYDLRPFSSWIVHSNLKTLDLVIASTPQNQSPLHTVVNFLDNLNPCSLKVLKITYEEYGGPRYHLDDETLMETIAFICGSLNMEYQVWALTTDPQTIDGHLYLVHSK